MQAQLRQATLSDARQKDCTTGWPVFRLPIPFSMTWRPTIVAGNALAAAQTAMDNSAFYNVTLKNFAAPWSNRDQNQFIPLNDYTATVIGMIRDQVPFNEVLSADLLYIGDPTLPVPAYSMTNNNHYEALESRGVDLQAALVPVAVRRHRPAELGDRRRDDDPRCRRSIFRRRHQPRHVPIYASSITSATTLSRSRT